MKTTVQYLDAVRERLHLPSDYAVSKVLGITTAAVSKYRNGHGGFDDLTAAKVAEILGVDPLEVISACYFARAKDDRTRGLWEGIWGKAVGATAVATLTMCAVGLSVVPTPSQAAQNTDNGASIYIMSNNRSTTNMPLTVDATLVIAALSRLHNSQIHHSACRAER
ncbi:helix-turn-helix domain-containing protein [Paraburkholderia nemoris]|uniref:helix-turn-helix domain-containing protein n=1 Tax=Paraburkholderia nemoris TaxID=2793076 RepID=UPI0038BB51C4